MPGPSVAVPVTPPMKIPYVIMLQDTTGASVQEPSDVCTVASSDVTIATVVPDATPVVSGALQTGFIVLQPKEGLATINSHVVKPDGTVLPDVSGTVTVGSGPAVSQSMTFGTPVAQ